MPETMKKSARANRETKCTMEFNRRALRRSKNSILLGGVAIGCGTRGENGDRSPLLQRFKIQLLSHWPEPKPQTKLRADDVVNQPRIHTDFHR